MRLILLLSLCALATAGGTQAHAQAIPASMVQAFPDPAFRAMVIEKYDTDGDGKISQSEALAVTRITIYGDQITSAEGIQYFSNIDALICNAPNLRTLDIRRNRALKNVLISKSLLTQIDLSENMALETMGCINTRLTTIDLHDHKSLKSLRCDNNSSLRSINVNGCTALNTLTCAKCQLTSLDLSTNSALSWLWCNDNKIESLNLVNTNLETINCTMPSLKVIAVKKNTNIGRLKQSIARTTNILLVDEQGNREFYQEPEVNAEALLFLLIGSGIGF
ncbi:MAG: hypothetical protein J1D86_06200 [Alistipes sp.]|nr:hypothetical protein [Alistipes sp.]